MKRPNPTSDELIVDTRGIVIYYETFQVWTGRKPDARVQRFLAKQPLTTDHDEARAILEKALAERYFASLTPEEQLLDPRRQRYRLSSTLRPQAKPAPKPKVREPASPPPSGVTARMWTKHGGWVDWVRTYEEWAGHSCPNHIYREFFDGVEAMYENATSRRLVAKAILSTPDEERQKMRDLDAQAIKEASKLLGP